MATLFNLVLSLNKQCPSFNVLLSRSLAAKKPDSLFILYIQELQPFPTKLNDSGLSFLWTLLNLKKHSFLPLFKEIGNLSFLSSEEKNHFKKLLNYG